MLSSEEANKLYETGIQALHCLNAAACEANSQGILRFLIVPKVHIFNHLCIDAKKERYNCRGYHNFSGESYMKVLKLIFRTCNTGPRVEERVLKRTLLKVKVGQH